MPGTTLTVDHIIRAKRMLDRAAPPTTYASLSTLDVTTFVQISHAGEAILLGHPLAWGRAFGGRVSAMHIPGAISHLSRGQVVELDPPDVTVETGSRERLRLLEIVLPYLLRDPVQQARLIALWRDERRPTLPPAGDR